MTDDRNRRAEWFRQARFGIFLHWGPYAVQGRGEQVVIRELLDQREYERAACAWNPTHYDAAQWAREIAASGAKYAVLTTRHHDGYCLWDSRSTNYTSVKQAPKRDFVREYVDACRAAGLRVGLYYSLADFRVPAYFEGPTVNPTGWAAFRSYVHDQVRELLTNYGKIDVVWFDGVWPRSAAEWGSHELLAMMRSLQPDVLINNRLDGGGGVNDKQAGAAGGPLEAAGGSADLGDFGTPEHHITAEAHRPWESCQVMNWRLWGYTRGERWRPADLLIDMLTEAAGKGGNLLLNIGPDEQGRLPPEASERLAQIGEWMRVHGEAIYGSDAGGDVTEFVTFGRQIRKGNNLYLVLRFWDGRGTLRLVGLGTHVKAAKLLTTGQPLAFKQNGPELILTGLPEHRPTPLLPVIRLECDGPPKPVANKLYEERLWTGDATRYAAWARQRGEGVNVAT